MREFIGLRRSAASSRRSLWLLRPAEEDRFEKAGTAVRGVLRSFLRRNSMWAYFVIVLSVSLALNVVLGLQLRTTQRQMAAVRRAGIVVGRRLPPVEVLTLKGSIHLLSFTSPRPTVLYVFSPTCPYCEHDCHNLVALARQLPHYSFIGLSTHSNELGAFLARCNLPFPVFTATSSQLADAGDLAATPQTVVVGEDGRVQRVWVGMLVGNRRTEAEVFFRTKIVGSQGAG